MPYILNLDQIQCLLDFVTLPLEDVFELLMLAFDFLAAAFLMDLPKSVGVSLHIKKAAALTSFIFVKVC